MILLLRKLKCKINCKLLPFKNQYSTVDEAKSVKLSNIDLVKPLIGRTDGNA